MRGRAVNEAAGQMRVTRGERTGCASAGCQGDSGKLLSMVPDARAMHLELCEVGDEEQGRICGLAEVGLEAAHAELGASGPSGVF
jgi:hypothetical protein